MATMPDLKQNYPEWEELLKKFSDLENEVEKAKTAEIHKITTHPEYHYRETDITASEALARIRAGVDVSLLQDDEDAFVLYRFANNADGAFFIGYLTELGVSVRYHAVLDDTKSVSIGIDEE